jgi:hypothetical protein
MLKTKRDDPAGLLRLAIPGLDEQIAELQETRSQLAALIERSAGLAAETAAPRKQRKLSAEARAKISAAKARWARERKAKVKAQKPKTAAKKAQSKANPAKARPAPAKGKRSSAKRVNLSRPLLRRRPRR